MSNTDLRLAAVGPYWAQISQNSDGILRYVLARLTVFYQSVHAQLCISLCHSLLKIDILLHRIAIVPNIMKYWAKLQLLPWMSMMPFEVTKILVLMSFTKLLDRHMNLMNQKCQISLPRKRKSKNFRNKFNFDNFLDLFSDQINLREKRFQI